jgi:hypothetical protein
VAMNVFFSSVAHPVDSPIDGLAADQDAFLLIETVGRLPIGRVAADIQQSAQELQGFFIEFFGVIRVIRPLWGHRAALPIRGGPSAKGRHSDVEEHCDVFLRLFPRQPGLDRTDAQIV